MRRYPEPERARFYKLTPCLTSGLAQVGVVIAAVGASLGSQLKIRAESAQFPARPLFLGFPECVDVACGSGVVVVVAKLKLAMR